MTKNDILQLKLLQQLYIVFKMQINFRLLHLKRLPKC